MRYSKEVELDFGTLMNEVRAGVEQACEKTEGRFHLCVQISL